MDKDAISFRQRFSVRPMQGGNGFGLFMKDKLVGYANLKPGGPSGTPSFSYRYIHPSLQKLNLNNKFTGEILKRLPGGWTGTDLPMNYTPAGWKSLQKFIKQPSIEARPTYSLSAATDIAKQPLRHILHRLGLGPKPEPLPTYGDGSTYFLRMKSPGAKLPVPQEIAKNFPKAMQRDATRAIDTTTPAYDPAATVVQGVLRVPKQGSVLDDLIRAKKESDRGNYGEKHSLLQKLLRMKLEEFDIDSQEGREVGLTHRPTRFRIHIPKKKLPDSVSLRKKGAMYHGSSEDVETLLPKPSRVLDGSSAVFATPYRDVALSFAAPWRDNDFEQGSVDGQLYMRERYPKAFEKKFEGRSGYLYGVPSAGFSEDPRLTRFEAINRSEVKPHSKEQIKDILRALLEQKTVRLARFGEKLPWEGSLQKKESQITPVPAGPRTEAQLRKMYKEVEEERRRRLEQESD